MAKKKKDYQALPITEWPTSLIKRAGDPVPYGHKASGTALKFAEKVGRLLPDTGSDGKLLISGGKRKKVLVMSKGQRDHRDRLVKKAAAIAREIQTFETGLTTYCVDCVKK